MWIVSSGRKTLLGIGILWLAAIGAVLLLTQLGSTDGDDADEEEATATIVTPAATPPPAEPPTPYQVVAGDTLTSIAERFDASVQAIIDENRLADPDDLREGQTLLIPSPPPVWLEVMPPSITVGVGTELTLTGAKPSETITFEVHSPTGVYTGPPHTASEDGTVSTTYRPGIAGAPGTYTIIASGSEGTTAETTLQVDPADP